MRISINFPCRSLPPRRKNQRFAENRVSGIQRSTKIGRYSWSGRRSGFASQVRIARQRCCHRVAITWCDIDGKLETVRGGRGTWSTPVTRCWRRLPWFTHRSLSLSRRAGSRWGITQGRRSIQGTGPTRWRNIFCWMKHQLVGQVHRPHVTDCDPQRCQPI